MTTRALGYGLLFGLPLDAAIVWAICRLVSQL